MYRLVKYICTNYFTDNKQIIKEDPINKKSYDWDDILIILYQDKLIKYVYIKDNGLILINYTELNSKPLHDMIKYHPLNHGYGNFENQIISLYEDTMKKKIITVLLTISKSWPFPKDISTYICKFYWDLIK